MFVFQRPRPLTNEPGKTNRERQIQLVTLATGRITGQSPTLLLVQSWALFSFLRWDGKDERKAALTCFRPHPLACRCGSMTLAHVARVPRHQRQHRSWIYRASAPWWHLRSAVLRERTPVILAGSLRPRKSINSAVDPSLPVDTTRMDPPAQTRVPRSGLHAAKFKVLFYHRASGSVKQERRDTNVPRLRPPAWTLPQAPQRTGFNPEQVAP